MQSLYTIVPPPRKPPERQPDDPARRKFAAAGENASDGWRTMLAVAVICTGLMVAGLALWQARTARTFYVPIPVEAVTTTPVNPVRTVDEYPTSVAFAPSRTVISEPTSAILQPAAALPPIPVSRPDIPPPPVIDYAARDRQIADLKRQIDEMDETVRRVRADPHWYGLIKGSTDTSRQQSSDAYLDQLDRQRNELRRQKWALEGR